ncbi:hypothetical protein M422DRAFT_132301, partial [Sphaerobolus stellatus SS14]
GKHLWPLVLKVLKPVKDRISRRHAMCRIPRWRGLKHFYSVAEMDFADGNSFRDILKCIIPCIVQLLPSNASLKVTKDHGKMFNYPKHHNLIHLPEDVENKGCTENYSTHPGEGFQQEVQQAYKQTNFKDTGPQITRIDENQEAIARIRMFVDIYD